MRSVKIKNLYTYAENSFYVNQWKYIYITKSRAGCVNISFCSFLICILYFLIASDETNFIVGSKTGELFKGFYISFNLESGKLFKGGNKKSEKLCKEIQCTVTDECSYYFMK